MNELSKNMNLKVFCNLHLNNFNSGREVYNLFGGSFQSALESLCVALIEI